MKKMMILALLVLAILPARASAQTQTIDAKAQILKSQIEGFLDNQKSMALKNHCLLETRGDITVEKSASGYYAFTLPHVTYTDAKGIKSEIGMVAINALPEGADNWNMSIALPTPIISYDKAGAQIFKTDIGTQNSTGVWNEKLGHFTKVNAALSNVQFSNILDSNVVTVQSLSIISDLKEQDPEAYTGKADMALNGITYKDNKSGITGNLEKITFATNLADRAAKVAMTKDDIKARPLGAYPDAFNIFAQLLGAPERVDGRIKGLDSLSAQISQSMLAAKPDQRAAYLSAILGVGAVSALGKPDPADASWRYYDVVFGQDGGVLLNGADVNGILNAKK